MKFNLLYFVLLLLSAFDLNAKIPRYLEQKFDIGEIPENMTCIDELLEDRLKHAPECAIEQCNYLNVFKLTDEELAALIPIVNIYDGEMMDPVSFQMPKVYQYSIVGNFVYKDIRYLVYMADYFLDGATYYLARMDECGNFPQTLIISRSGRESKLVDFKVNRENGTVSIKALKPGPEFFFMTETVYSLEEKFKQIDSKYFICLSCTPLDENLMTVDVRAMEWMEYDWTLEAEKRFKIERTNRGFGTPQ